MDLGEELKRYGISQNQLSAALGVSRATVNRMRDKEVLVEHLAVLRELAGEEISPVEKLAEKLKDWDEYTLDEIRELCHRRRGEKVKRMVKDKEVEVWEYEEDWEIAASLGLKTWQFSRMLDKLRDIGKRKVATEILEGIAI